MYDIHMNKNYKTIILEKALVWRHLRQAWATAPAWNAVAAGSRMQTNERTQ